MNCFSCSNYKSGVHIWAGNASLESFGVNFQYIAFPSKLWDMPGGSRLYVKEWKNESSTECIAELSWAFEVCPRFKPISPHFDLNRFRTMLSYVTYFSSPLRNGSISFGCRWKFDPSFVLISVALKPWAYFWMSLYTNSLKLSYGRPRRYFCW